MTVPAKRFGYWPMLFLFPLLILSVIYFDAHHTPPTVRPEDAGQMTAVMSIIALLCTVWLAPVVADQDLKRYPRWAGAIVAVCLAELLALLFTSGSWDQSMAPWARVYVPGILLSLHLTALVLVHAWVASWGLDQPAQLGLFTGGSITALILWLGGTLAFGLLQILGIMTLAICTAFSAIIALQKRASRPS